MQRRVQSPYKPRLVTVCCQQNIEAPVSVSIYRLTSSLIHLSATLRATLAWNHPNGLTTGHASRASAAGDLSVRQDCDTALKRDIQEDLLAPSGLANRRRLEQDACRTRTCSS
jgi:hypothetical protein